MRPAWTSLSQNTRLLYLIFCLCQCTQAITVQVERSTLTAPVQGSALLSVDITSAGTPAVRWMFTSAGGQQSIAAWMFGGPANITETYEGRVQAHPNGSLTITGLRLQDSGYYTLTVTDASGSSKDTCVVLSVTEVLYEDIQYFIVFIIVLGTLAAFLMLCMWLLNKLHNVIKARTQQRHLPEHSETELQPL